MEKTKRTTKKAYCLDCKREVPIIIVKTKKVKQELLQTGKCIFCSSEITLVECT